MNIIGLSNFDQTTYFSDKKSDDCVIIQGKQSAVACTFLSPPQPSGFQLFVGGRYHNLKNGKEASEDTEESPAGCAGEGKQNKKNSRREQDGLQITDNKHYVREKVSSFFRT